MDGAWLWAEVGVTEGIRPGLPLMDFYTWPWLPVWGIDEAV